MESVTGARSWHDLQCVYAEGSLHSPEQRYLIIFLSPEEFPVCYKRCRLVLLLNSQDSFALPLF